MEEDHGGAKKPEGRAAYELLKELEIEVTQVKGVLETLRTKLLQVEEVEEVEEAVLAPIAGILNDAVKPLCFKRYEMGFVIELSIDIAGSGDDLAAFGAVQYSVVRKTVSDEDRKLLRLVEFSVSRHGLIQDPGGLSGRWSHDGDEVADLHYRLLASVLPDAARKSRQNRMSDRG